MPPIAIGIAGAASSLIGGVVAKKGADKAAKAQETAAREANAEARRQFDIGQKNLGPWLGAGAAASGRLSYLLGLNPVMGDPTRSFQANFGPQGEYIPPGGPSFGGAAPGGFVRPPGSGPRRRMWTGFDGDAGLVGGRTPGLPASSGLTPTSGADFVAGTTGVSGPATGAPGGTDGEYGSLMRDFTTKDFEKDPGYDFRLKEGAQALERSAAARGVLGSGEFLKDLTQYNQDFASNEFGNAYNRFQTNRTTKYNFLAGPAGYGQLAAQQSAGLGRDFAQQYGSNLMRAAESAGALRASGYGLLGGSIASALPTGLAAYETYKRKGT